MGSLGLGGTALMKPRISRRKRLVLFPVPFQGHINPMLQLANILYSNGFSITILHTRYNSPNKSNYPHFTFRAVLDDEDSNESKAMSTAGFDDHAVRVLQMNQNGAVRFRVELERMMFDSMEEEEPIACLITDAIWHFTQSVADSLKLPRLVLRTSSLFCVSVYSTTFLLGQDVFLANRDLNSEERVPGFPILKLKDISKMGIKSLKDPMAELLDNMFKQMKASAGIIWNSAKELEEPELSTILQVFPVPSFPIGPFHRYFPASSSSLIEQDRSFLPWLDLQAPKSVIYISFGSVARLDEKDLVEIAHGLANSNQPFLWILRPGSVKGSEWLEALPNGFIEAIGERGRIAKWAPQQEVLAHPAIGAFWTHNGWNSTVESICEGVPMICSPSFGDQPFGARYVSDVWRVGVYLENGFRREEIESAIKRVMVEKEGEEIRERARCLKDKVDLGLMKGGSSYESLQSLVDYISSF